MFQWIALTISMIELGFIAYHATKRQEVPITPVCIFSTLTIIFVMLHFSIR